MFMGPMDGYPDFRDTGIEGMRRFLERVWNFFVEYKDLVVVEEKDARKILIKMHQTIKKVTQDIKEFKYNTAIAAIMEYVNLLRETAVKNKIKNSGKALGVGSKATKVRCAEWDEALKTLCLLLNPFAPHFSEEVWHSILNQETLIQIESWPCYKEELTIESEVVVPVQVDGKLRATVSLDKSLAEDKEEVIKVAKENANVAKWLKDREVLKEVFIPGKLLNIVTKGK